MVHCSILFLDRILILCLAFCLLHGRSDCYYCAHGTYGVSADVGERSSPHFLLSLVPHCLWLCRRCLLDTYTKEGGRAPQAQWPWPHVPANGNDIMSPRLKVSWERDVSTVSTGLSREHAQGSEGGQASPKTVRREFANTHSESD